MNKVMAAIGCISAAAMLLSGCGKDSGTQSSTGSQQAPTAPVAAAPAPAPAPAPEVVTPPPATHNYSMVDNGTYGYEPALSEDDVRKGTATKPLIMMRYVGNKGGTYVIVILGSDANDVSVANRVSCQPPCEFAKSETVAGDAVVNTQTVRVTPDSIVGAMLTDAISGQLVPFGRTTAAQQIMPPQNAPNAPAPTPAAPPTPEASVGTAQQPQGGDAPLQQTSFDCNQAGSIPQYLICHDVDLAASDRALAGLVEKARAAAQDQTGFSDRIRKQWNFREKTCKDKACLTSWYAYENDILTKIAQSGNVAAN
ncbi:hypothetical protein [Paraburkholderia aromaticivorans]|uniref:hypothetical protein n=1 Tax=Paraburkholderia aromaticivorans TaxID=2026199 RepID=UPI001F0EF12E|nr:hypothetical protein [Paraburkholderia aromaticivorans]